MGSPIVYTLFNGLCCMGVVRDAHAECCITMMDVEYTVESGTCASAGGYGGSTCDVRICADGVAQVGTFCGRGPCNIFGCNCDYGCLSGEWDKSFLERNKEYGVRILNAHKIPE